MWNFARLVVFEGTLATPIISPAQHNQARGHDTVDQRYKSITSLSLHLSDGLSEFAMVSSNPFTTLRVFTG